MTAIRRQMLDFARGVLKARTLTPKLEREGLHLVEQLKPRKRPMRPHKKERLARRAAKREETAEIRAAVFARAGGECELHPQCLAEPTDMHHLEGGNGRRLQQQAVHNCMAACRLHHADYHRNPEAYREHAQTWCDRYGYPLPSRFRRDRR